MRQFSFAIGRTAQFAPLAPTDDRAPLRPLHPPRKQPRRRLEDAVEDTFHAALERGDLASAKDLLEVMASMDARGRERFPSRRDSTRRMIDRARDELASRKTRYL